jgi:cell division transport system permease protein
VRFLVSLSRWGFPRLTRKPERSPKQTSSWQQLGVTAQRAGLELLREPLSSLTSIVVIAITLVLPLTLFSAASKLESTLEQYAQSPQLVAYLRTDGPVSLLSEVSERLLSRADVSYIELVPKALGLSQFSEDSGLGDLIAELGSNPLPDVLLVTPLALDVASLEELARTLAQDPDIESAELDTQWLQRLQGLVGVIKSVASLIGSLAVLAFFLVIGTTIRALIRSSIDEIRIQKLIGATDFYVIKPLIFKGLYYGFGGSVLAVLLQLLVYALLNSALTDFLSLYSDMTDTGITAGSTLDVSWLVCLAAIGASCALGAVAAALFAKQQILKLYPT